MKKNKLNKDTNTCNSVTVKKRDQRRTKVNNLYSEINKNLKM